MSCVVLTAGSRDTHTVRASLEGPNFSGVDPANGGQSERVADNEKVREGDNSICVRASNTHGNIGIALDTLCYSHQYCHSGHEIE
jgi:hypothetical protein